MWSYTGTEKVIKRKPSKKQRKKRSTCERKDITFRQWDREQTTV